MEITATKKRRYQEGHPENFTKRTLHFTEALALVKDCHNPLDQQDLARFKELEEGHYFFSDKDFEYRIQIKRTE